MRKKLVLIDGHSILNRAFYGVPDLSNAEGLHTNAIYGFLNIMFKIVDEEKPDYMAVAFDLKAPTFRHKIYPEYKGTRKGMLDELREQGIKAGLLKIRVYRPFPGEEVAKALSHLKAVAVLDKSDSLNGIGGALFEDVTSSMFVNQVQVPTVNYVYGIGGRDTKADDIEKVYDDLLEISKTGSADNPYRYFGVRKEAK